MNKEETTYYMCKREKRLEQSEQKYLIKELGLTYFVLNEQAEEVLLAASKGEGNYCYFFRKLKLFVTDLSVLKRHGLTLVINREEAEQMEKRINIEQFLIEIV